MTDIIDILSLIKACGRTLRGVDVYGAATRIMERPASLLSSVEVASNCVCVNVDMFAVNLTRYANQLKEAGITSPSNIYFVNGSMACYIDKCNPIPDWYTFSGNLTIGTKADSNYVVMFNFAKREKGWSISSTNIQDLNYNGWEESRLAQYLNDSARNGRVIVPNDVTANLARCISQIAPVQVPQVPVAGSLNSQLQGVLNNTYVNPVASRVSSKERFIVEDKNSLRDYSTYANNLNDILEVSSEKRNKYISYLCDKYQIENEVNEHIKFLFDGLKTYFRNKPSQGNTGRSLVKGYLMLDEESYNKPYLDDCTAGEYALRIFDEIVDYSLNNAVISASKSAMTLIESAFGEPEIAYAGILAQIVGIDAQACIAVAQRCLSNGMSFAKIVNTNPYELILISASLSVKDVEKLAHALGFTNNLNVNSEDIKGVKNICYLYDFFMYSDNGNTCYNLRDIQKANIGYQ